MTDYAKAFDYGLTEEQLALKHSAVEFTKREVSPYIEQWEKDGEIPRDFQKKLAAAGLIAVGLPEEKGGDGGTLMDLCVMQEGFMSAGWSGGLMASAFTHGIALPHIIQHGSDELVDTYVRPTLSGELIGSLGVTEPGTGSDVAGITTRAVRDGDEWVINGAKMFITSSVRGDFVTTAVRTADTGAHGISMIVVPKGTPQEAIDRINAAATAALKVPETAEKLRAGLTEPIGGGPREFAELIAKETKRWPPLIQQYGIRLD